MYRYKLIFLLLISTHITGCSNYYASQDNFNDRIDTWLGENNFLKIENSLNSLSKDHLYYKTIVAKKPLIKKKKQNFIKSTLAKADNFQRADKWQNALDIFDNALDKTGKNKPLETARNKLLKERDTQVNELRKNMLLRRARALVQYMPIYKKLEKLIPKDYSAQYDINKYKKEKEELVAHLNDCGKSALKNKNSSLAEECYSLSNKLKNSKQILSLLNNIKNKRKTNEKKRKESELIALYQESYNSGDFPKARLYLGKLISLKPGQKKTLELKAQLDRDINSRVEKGITKGKKLYSQSKIASALAIWKDLLIYDPKNEELTALISRADKVNRKIKKLEKSSTNK